MYSISVPGPCNVRVTTTTSTLERETTGTPNSNRLQVFSRRSLVFVLCILSKLGLNAVRKTRHIRSTLSPLRVYKPFRDLLLSRVGLGSLAWVRWLCTILHTPARSTRTRSPGCYFVSWQNPSLNSLLNLISMIRSRKQLPTPLPGPP